MTSEEAKRRKALEKLGAAFPSGWTNAARDVYAEQLLEFPPDLVNRVVVAVIGAAPKYRPTPGEIRMACLAEREAAQLREARERTHRLAGTATPCPECEREGLEHADVRRAERDAHRHYQPAEPAEVGPADVGWAACGMTGLVYCRQHRIAWRGRLPDHDPGLMLEPLGPAWERVLAGIEKRLAEAKRPSVFRKAA